MAKYKKRSLRRNTRKVRKSRSKTRKSMNRYYGGENPYNSNKVIYFQEKINKFLTNTSDNQNQAIIDLIEIRVLFSIILYRDPNITDEYREIIMKIYNDFTAVTNEKYQTFTRENKDAINIAMGDRNSELGMFYLMYPNLRVS
jgi:hypothetical protein